MIGYDALKKMDYIESLSIWNGNIDDSKFENLIESIEDLPNLETLSLPNNQISDISPLIVMRYLKNLNLENNQVEDVSPLLLLNLSSLNLSDNPLENPEIINHAEIDDLTI